MITVNLLKEHHGIRARLLAEGECKESKPGIPVIKLLVFVSFFLFITAGFIYGKRAFFSYVEELDNSEPVQMEEFFNEETFPAVQKELSLEEPPSKVKKEPAQPPVKLTAKKKYFVIRVATLVVEQNAERLARRLNDMGMPVSVKKDAIEMPSYQLIFEDVLIERSETVANILKEAGLSFDIMKQGDGLEISSDEVFVKSFAEKILKGVQGAGVSGKIVQSRKKTDIHKVLLGKYFDKEKMLKDFEELKRNDFSPIFFTMK